MRPDRPRVAWVAPEHEWVARRMRRDRRGDLVIDPRPAIMRPRLEAPWVPRRRKVTIKGYEAARRSNISDAFTANT